MLQFAWYCCCVDHHAAVGHRARLVVRACGCVTTPPAGSDVAWVTVPPVGAAGVACTPIVVADVCVHADV
jgi:hypothetical protein